MPRKRRSSQSSKETDDSSEEDEKPRPPPPKRPATSSSSKSLPTSECYLTPAQIASRRVAALSVVNAMETVTLKPNASTTHWAGHNSMKAYVDSDITPLDPSLPRNTSFPKSLSYPPKRSGDARLVFWNINGVVDSTEGNHSWANAKASMAERYGVSNSAQKTISTEEALQAYIKAEDADIVCLAETKLRSNMSIADVENDLPQMKKAFPVRLGNPLGPDSRD